MTTTSPFIVVAPYGGTIDRNYGFGTTSDGLCILSRHGSSEAAQRKIAATHAVRHNGPFEVRNAAA